MTTLQTRVTRPIREKRPVGAESVRDNRKKEFLEQFAALGRRLEEHRKENGLPEEPFTMEEIVAVVKEIRTEKIRRTTKDGNANYLITGDDDLLVLKNFGKTKIVTMTEFENTI